MLTAAGWHVAAGDTVLTDTTHDATRVAFVGVRLSPGTRRLARLTRRRELNSLLQSLRLGKHRSLEFLPQHDHVMLCGDFSEHIWSEMDNAHTLASGDHDARHKLAAAHLDTTTSSNASIREHKTEDRPSAISVLRSSGFQEGDAAAFKPT